ncbi:MAG: UvrD-helicase domain-containing protein [Jatrophihabitans sp.]
MTAAPRISAERLAEQLGLHTPTAEQCAVIEAPLGPAVVIAGAGSGKTETMATRVVWLIANRMVRAEQVLGLTFTRKAAAELTNRIRRHLTAWRYSLPPNERELIGEDPTVLTYAAYAGRLVADHGLRLGVEPAARLISPAVSWQLSDRVMRTYEGEVPEELGAPSSITGYLQQLSGQFADHLVDPADVQLLADRLLSVVEELPTGPKYDATVGKLVSSLQCRVALLPMVREYTQAKRALDAVDFADQMVAAARLAGVDDVVAAERRRFTAVLLDEYQDTGYAQIQMLKGLFGAGHPVTAVGDPFQSIYGWRGASAGNIGRFGEDFPGPDEERAQFTLSTSWRNDRAVLTGANAIADELRAHDVGTVPLAARDGAGAGEVQVAFCETSTQEADWLAGQVRRHWDALAAGGATERTAAVLVRRRTQIPLLVESLLSAGLPVEVVDLGGLLLTPEVSDVVATLQVLADRSGGKGLLRLLTGARWRIGPRDLYALSRRASRLANPDRDAERRERGSIVEALDDLGTAEHYSAEGFRRMVRLAEELRGLRRRLSAPLPELIADIERTLGLDVEVAARADRARVGRRHLDRFLDEAARFALEADQATLPGFLAYLDAAEEEEYGLTTGEVEVDPERVQVLTVHGAKGLEWDVVALPGLSDTIFPSTRGGTNWTTTRQVLPTPLRGDRIDLPEWNPAGVGTRKELDTSLKQYADELKGRALLEERRLAYVGVTRARHALLGSGYAWDAGRKKPLAPSQFLVELRADTEADLWWERGEDPANPLDVQPVPVAWPLDPLGDRRADVEHAAALVHAAAEGPEALPLGSARWAEWGADVEALLAERARQVAGERYDVPLPAQLSVSALVAIRDDAARFARRLRRPLPQRPAPLARRGTAFHLWLEQRWAGERLLDVDELPGAADAEQGSDADLVELRAAFEASRWAALTPHEVEVPFEMAIAGVVVRGRMDAVFGVPDQRVPDPDHAQWLVVDWKTGAVPTGAGKQAAAVQLAAYRIAWAALNGIPDDQLHRVRAAFQYVRHDEFVEPTQLLDADGLRRLIEAAAAEGPVAADTPG